MLSRHSLRSLISFLMSPKSFSSVSFLSVSTLLMRGGTPCRRCPWRGSQSTRLCTLRSSCRCIWPANLILLFLILSLTLGSFPSRMFFGIFSFQETFSAIRSMRVYRGVARIFCQGGPLSFQRGHRFC